MRWSLFLMPWFLLSSAFGTCEAPSVFCPWVVVYAKGEPLKAFSPYNPIVLDSTYHPPLKPLLDDNKMVLGYISLGEIEKERPYFEEVKKAGLIIEENPNWPGSYIVDLRNPKWADIILRKAIPEIVKQGFNGLFFDTLDSPVYKEEEFPEKYKGMKIAAADLVRLIRVHYPNLKLMMNRAYALLPEVGSIIDMELGESVYTDYNFETKEYDYVEKALYESQVKKLQSAAEKFDNLDIYTLDYWNPRDKKTIKEIYAEERKNGFIPYVSTIDLDQIIPEPK